jgi:hypothetical protein
MARYGLWALAAAKFFPGTLIPTLAGALGMSTRRFLLFDGFAALFYGTSYVTAGFLLHNQVQRVLVWLGRLGHGVIGLVLLLAVGYLAYKYALRRRALIGKGRRSSPPDQKPGLTDNHAYPASIAMDGLQRLEVAPAVLADTGSSNSMLVSTAQLP